MFTLELHERMVMVIIQALGNFAYKDSAPVIAELQKQINAQTGPRSNGKDVNVQPSP